MRAQMQRKFVRSHTSALLRGHVTSMLGSHAWFASDAVCMDSGLGLGLGLGWLNKRVQGGRQRWPDNPKLRLGEYAQQPKRQMNQPSGLGRQLRTRYTADPLLDPVPRDAAAIAARFCLDGMDV